jgi:hypothetical protein
MSANVKSKNKEVQERLQRVRDALLALHKALVDSERETYERTFGRIAAPNQFLKLVINDPWFAWLHPLSQLIVSMDEALDEKMPLTAAAVDALVNQSRALLVASETGEGFSGHYFVALQRDPGVVLAHANAAKLFKPRKPLA